MTPDRRFAAKHIKFIPNGKLSYNDSASNFTKTILLSHPDDSGNKAA